MKILVFYFLSPVLCPPPHWPFSERSPRPLENRIGWEGNILSQVCATVSPPVTWQRALTGKYLRQSWVMGLSPAKGASSESPEQQCYCLYNPVRLHISVPCPKPTKKEKKIKSVFLNRAEFPSVSTFKQADSRAQLTLVGLC